MEIDGRPRRNDPHTGRDDTFSKPQPESLFSIQFIPAYAIAWPARLLGLSMSTAFIVLMFLAALASTASIFVLIWSVTNDARLAAAGVIVVLCLGTLVATQGEVRSLLGSAPTYSFFPFLRRYQPALPFPLFFVFCLLVWRALKSDALRQTVPYGAAAGITFAVLVFSYFYLWTAAAAWLATVSIIWFIWQPASRKQLLLLSGIVALCALPALALYAKLLSNRDPNMDQVQLLSLTHAPDLLRVPELISIALLIALFIGRRRGVIELSSPAVLFVVSLVLMSLVVFNQQIITGHSLQPLHYQLFIANYVSLLALVLTVSLLLRTSREIPSRALALVALLAFGWGVFESTGATKRDVDRARLRDDAIPVAKRLSGLAQTDGALNALRGTENPRPIVFSSTLPLADCLPTSTAQASLWALHMDAFPGASTSERKLRFFQYLYYSGTSSTDLEKAIVEGRFAIMAALFGVERIIPGLAANVKPLELEEMRREWLSYKQYTDGFSRAEAAHFPLSYVVVPTEAPPDLSHLDRWYERGPAETAGLFTIYRVKLRP
jgi:hypothetical protein